MAIAAFSPIRSIQELANDRQCAPQSPDYTEAERQFVRLLETDQLDHQVNQSPELVIDFEAILSAALLIAYGGLSAADSTNDAHLFLQRILYHINRLNLFWYDDLQRYKNERSLYLQCVRDLIEESWQDWELQQCDVELLQHLSLEQIKQELLKRGDADLDPPVSENKRYLREDMSLEGYRHLLAIASLDGLVEASRLSRILGGAGNEVQATLIRVLLEEYGNGRLSHKHSTFFAQMMADLGLNTEPEGYFDIVPWQVLASINHNFLLTECKQHFLRYNGGLTYFEVAGPSIYTDYMLAAQRLNLSGTAMGYWKLHIREDERHGHWMLQEVALPLVDRYPNEAWQVLFGYDQEKWIGDRAGDAMIRAIKQAESASMPS
jgi:hypothetical protein